MATGPRHTSTNWPAVAAAIATGVVAATCVGKLPPAIPAMRDEFQLSLVTAGWVNSTFNTLAVTTAIAFGALAARAGALRACIGGLIALMLGGLLGAWATSAAVLIATRVIEGAGFIAIAVSAPALIAASSAASERNLTLGLWSIYLPFGASLAMFASPLLLGTLGWRGLWLSIVALAAVCLAALWRARAAYTTVRAGTKSDFARTLRALRQPGPWWLGLAFSCYALIFYALMVWLPSFLVQDRGASLTLAALLTAAVVAMNVVGNLLGTWLIHHAAERGSVIMAAFLVDALCALGIFATTLPDPMRALLCALFMLAGGTIPAAVLSGVQAYARDTGEFSSIQGLIVQLSQLGPFFGPPLVAAAVTLRQSWDAALWVMLGFALLGMVFGQRAARAEAALAARA